MSQIQDEAYTELCLENERLKFLLKEEQATIDELANLLIRAANALEYVDWTYLHYGDRWEHSALIAQLRNAAE